MFNFDLSQLIEPYIIKNSPCKEYDIIQHLQRLAVFKQDCFHQPLSLFRCHFLIFNALYRLQQKSLIHNQYRLCISSLEIRIEQTPSSVKSSTNTQETISFDPLALFYLDLKHLSNTTETDVNKLLTHFWQYYFNDDQKQQALATLELHNPVDFTHIKKQYRRLAMQHHPDRGGDANKLIEIHQAMQCLQQYYP